MRTDLEPSGSASGTGIMLAMSPIARLRGWWSRWRVYGGWIGAVLGMFFLFAWLSLPTEAIAWRIGYEAKKRGYDIEVEDVSVSPFGGITLENVRWTFEPSRPGDVPFPFIIESMDLDISLIKWLFGTTDIEVAAEIDDGTIEAEFVKNEESSHFALEIVDLPVYSLPKVRQWFNAPMHGLVNVSAELDMPEGLYANANGTVELSISNWKVGDGETLLFVPWSKGLLSKGVTIPEIDLGTMEGKLIVEEGTVKTESPVKTDSDDLKAELEGSVQLRDPVNQSRVAMTLVVQLSEQLQQKNESIRLMVQTAHPTTRLEAPREGLGFRLDGPVGRPRFQGINAKSRQDRLREQRRRARERAQARKRRAANKKKNNNNNDKPEVAPEPEADADVVIEEPDEEDDASRVEPSGRDEQEGDENGDLSEAMPSAPPPPPPPPVAPAQPAQPIGPPPDGIEDTGGVVGDAPAQEPPVPYPDGQNAAYPPGGEGTGGAGGGTGDG